MGSVRLAALVCLALSSPALARAQSPRELESEFRRGMRLRDQGRNAEAAELFQRLYQSTGDARAVARLALAEAAQSNWVASEEHFRVALSLSHPWIDENRAALQQNLDIVEGHLGTLEVTSSAPGAELWSGDEWWGPIPMQQPRRVLAGHLRVEVRADGYLSEAREMDVPVGRDPVRVEVALRRVDGRAETPSAEPPPAPVEAPTAPVVVTPPAPVTPPTPPPSPRPWRTVMWLAAGGAVLAGGATLALGLIASDRYDTLRSSCAPRCAQSDADRISADATLVNVGIGLTSAFAATALVSWILDRPAASAYVALDPRGALLVGGAL